MEEVIIIVQDESEDVTITVTEEIENVTISIIEGYTEAVNEHILNSFHPVIVKVTDVSANRKLADIPQGHVCESIWIMEKTGMDVKINLGSDPAGSDILPEQDVVGGKPNHIILPFADNIDLDPFDIYISSFNWNNSSLDVFITLKKLQ